jgi:putative oxidoreductase
MKVVSNLLGRILMSAIFISAGISKLSSAAAIQGTMGYMKKAGVPLETILFWPGAVGELVGGIALLVGLFTRWAALGLIIFTIVATYYFHMNLGDRMQFILFMKNLFIIGGLFYVMAHSDDNPLSVDAIWKK